MKIRLCNYNFIKHVRIYPVYSDLTPFPGKNLQLPDQRIQQSDFLFPQIFIRSFKNNRHIIKTGIIH